MTRFLLDTNVPSELTRLKSNPDVERWLDEADDDQLYLSVISLGELMKGLTLLPAGKRRTQVQEWLDHTLRPWFEGRMIAVDSSISERWGMLAGQCQLRGTPLNTTDGLIAATALEHHLTVATRNVRDFAGLGVQVYNPWEPESKSH